MCDRTRGRADRLGGSVLSGQFSVLDDIRMFGHTDINEGRRRAGAGAGAARDNRQKVFRIGSPEPSCIWSAGQRPGRARSPGFHEPDARDENWAGADQAGDRREDGGDGANAHQPVLRWTRREDAARG